MIVSAGYSVSLCDFYGCASVLSCSICLSVTALERHLDADLHVRTHALCMNSERVHHARLLTPACMHNQGWAVIPLQRDLVCIRLHQGLTIWCMQCGACCVISVYADPVHLLAAAIVAATVSGHQMS